MDPREFFLFHRPLGELSSHLLSDKKISWVSSREESSTIQKSAPKIGCERGFVSVIKVDCPKVLEEQTTLL